MATIREITAKCKAGEIAESYEIALHDWQNAPNDVWEQRKVGWALYYFIKDDVDNHRTDDFYDHLDQLSELSLLDMASDNLIFENLLWKVAEFVKGIRIEDFTSMEMVFSKIQNYRFGPSRPYSLLLQYFIKFEGWDKLADFIDWWDLNNLMPDDYEQFRMESGKKVMALAERVYIAYSKALLKLNDQERIAAFIPNLEALMDAHSDMLYPGYFCGKLLIAQGASRDEALEKVIPFVRKKINEFWAWQLMSDIFKEDNEIQLACLLRAVHCKTQEAFLGKIRIRLADFYLRNNDYPRAKFHIDKVSTCYLQQGWKLPYQVQQWAWQSWLQNTQPDSSDPIDYKLITDEVLFTNLDECMAVITHVDKQARKVTIVYGVKKKTVSKYSSWELKPKEGKLLRLKYVPDRDTINIVRVEAVHDLISLPFIKQVSGTIVKQEDSPFAFLKDGSEKCFVAPALVSRYLLNRNDRATALAVYDFNKKKNEWGWSVITIKRETATI